MKIRLMAAMLAATAVLPFAAANATDLEVTHWWTSGGEAAAVAELAKAFDATGNKWIDGAIAGSGGTARPIMISRITGGDPMGATQFNHGRQAQELVEAGLMRDLTAVAEAGKWKEVIKPSSLLDSCTTASADQARVDVLALEPVIPVRITAIRPARRPHSQITRAMTRCVQAALAEIA